MELDQIVYADVGLYLKLLPDESVNCVITSPPYWGLRDYKTEGQIGAEKTPAEYVARLVEVFREIKRILRKDGTVWLNLGDTYASSWAVSRRNKVGSGSLENGKREARPNRLVDGLKEKDLIGIPWRVAFALQDDGWVLRSDIIWAKPACMPESVTDRPTKSHEYVFLLAKSARYWYDNAAIKEPNVKGDAGSTYTKGKTAEAMEQQHAQGKGPRTDKQAAVGKRQYVGFNDRWDNAPTLTRNDRWDNAPTLTRNKRSVWTVATEPNSLAHFATFPTKLIEPMILAGCPDKVCATCGKPWVRKVVRIQEHGNAERSFPKFAEQDKQYGHKRIGERIIAARAAGEEHDNPLGKVLDLGLEQACKCENADVKPGVVLDPFMGSGTTALVARRLGRHFLGCDSNPEYVRMATERLANTDPFQDKALGTGEVQMSLFTGGSADGQ